MVVLSRWALRRTRAAIDHLDDALVVLLAARQRLAGIAGRIKRGTSAPMHDAPREQQVRGRATRLARRSGLAPDSADRLMDLLISEAHRQQTMAPFHHPSPSGPTMTAATSAPFRAFALRILPPPRRWRSVLKVVPRPWQTAALLGALSSATAAPEARRALQPIAGRQLGIRVDDLDLQWTLELRDGRVQLSQGEPEATVSGSATDLLLLASRQEDADTLFFQRRLKLTGDTELGLTLRNLLDRLPWESLPLASRILLHRGSRLLRDARDSHRARTGAQA